MDREKLNKVAITYAKKNTTALNPFGRIMDDFKSGADWLMQQPISERLTDEEKKKINKLQEEIYGEIMCAHDDDDWKSVAHYILDVMPRTFASIFGADLFK